jgi:hypothetical protein
MNVQPTNPNSNVSSAGLYLQKCLWFYTVRQPQLQDLMLMVVGIWITPLIFIISFTPDVSQQHVSQRTVEKQIDRDIV